MKFQPKTREELDSELLIEPGTYKFQVMKANDAYSKAGNEMIKLELKIWDNNGHERIVFDYLLEAMGHKLRHFCESCEVLDKYESGELRAFDLPGRTGQLVLLKESERPNPQGGYFPAKNSVKDYVGHSVNGKPAATQAGAVGESFDDDKIPF